MKRSTGKTNPSARGRTLAIFASVALTLGMTACGGGGSSSGAAANSSVVIETVSPAVGSTYGGTIVTISGAGFTLGTTMSKVTFGGLSAADVMVLDDNTITARTPAGTPGSSVTVRVQNSDGLGQATGGFHYLVPAQVSSDLDDDGIADLVIAAPFEDLGGSNAGAVYVFLGQAGGHPQADTNASDSAIKIYGLEESARFGSSVATGDFDGDGVDDLLVGAIYDDTSGTDNGAVYLFKGPFTSGTIMSTASADLVLTGETDDTGDQFGTAIAIGDVDDDGKPDVVVTAGKEDANGLRPLAGAVYVFLNGATLTSMSADSADMKINGEAKDDELGTMVALEDVNGDGRDDLIVAAPRHDPPLPVPKKVDAGAVYVVFGGNIASGDVSTADVKLTGEEVKDDFGRGLAVGDINGDGVKDLMVGAPLNDRLGFNVGRVYLFNGGADLASGYAPNAADVILSGQPSNDNFGEVVTCGDSNADGFDDVVVGAPRASHGAIRNGRSYVYYGATAMSDSVATLADMIHTGEPVSHENFGQCTKVADWNRDGLADILVSAPGNDAMGPSAGRVYVFMGRQFGESVNALDSDAMLSGEAPGNLLGQAMANGQ